VIEKGVEWGREAAGPPELEVVGGDAALAAAVAAAPGRRVRFRPDPTSDFARAVGATSNPTDVAPQIELPCDLLRVRLDDAEQPAVNMVVVGVAPDRQSRWSRPLGVHVEVDGRTLHDGAATAVVIANGEYLRATDVVPRGHPGDGRAEVHVYALTASERAQLRGRLRRGEHLPNPRIVVRTGRTVRITSSGIGGLPVEVDGVAGPIRHGTVAVEVVPGAFLLLV
jgi:diacylglycerol kinase (ATP)